MADSEKIRQLAVKVAASVTNANNSVDDASSIGLTKIENLGNVALSATRGEAEEEDIRASSDSDTPRSKLDVISKSYHAPSSILRPKTVDFEASVMKLSDNDERLRAQIEVALKTQKEVFERKLETYAAVHRNFEILKKISIKQQEDFHATMRHSKEVELKFSHTHQELQKLKKVHQKVSTDLDALKKKELEF